MASIKRVHLQNYKSLRDVDLELGKLNVLIGENGSGKSNLLSFFSLMQNAANERLGERIRSDGGLSEIRWRGDEGSLVELMIDFDDLSFLNEGQIGHYGIKLADNRVGYSVENEVISDTLRVGIRPYFEYLSSVQGHASISLGSRDDSPRYHKEAIGDRELSITLIRDRSSFPALAEIRETLITWQVYRGLGEDALSNIRRPQPLDVVDPLHLDPQARNLVSILYELRENDYSVFSQLLEQLRTAFEYFADLKINVVGSGMVSLSWATKDFVDKIPFPAHIVSDGMLRFLTLATLLLLPDPPSLIAIDEPEIGLHPSLLPQLAELLKLASERTQIVVATHAPSLLSAEAIELSDIVLVGKRNGETIMERADTRQDLHRWLDRYSLGNLWSMGKLEVE